MQDKGAIVGILFICVSAIICFITSIITFNCLADGKDGCAQKSGFVALTTCACFVSAVGALMFYTKRS